MHKSLPPAGNFCCQKAERLGNQELTVANNEQKAEVCMYNSFLVFENLHHLKCWEEKPGGTFIPCDSVFQCTWHKITHDVHTG